MKEPKTITYDEAMSGLEKYSPEHGGQNRYRFTPQMDKLILKARGKGMSYRELLRLWTKLGWTPMARSTLHARAKLLEDLNH